MPEIAINGAEIAVAAGAAIVQPCALVGADIARFYYSDRLGVMGNLRNGLAEMKPVPPMPQKSCATKHSSAIGREDRCL